MAKKKDPGLPVPGERKKPKFRNKEDREAYEAREKAAKEYDHLKDNKGGMLGKAKRAFGGRKQQLDAAEAKAMGKDPEGYAKGGVVRGYGKATRGRKFIGVK